MQITINHQMRVILREPTARALLHLLLSPQSGPTQQVLDWTLSISGDAGRTEIVDCFGNFALFASLAKSVDHIDIAVSGRVDTVDTNGVLGRLVSDPVPALFKRMTPSTRSPVSVWSKFRNEDLNGPGRIEVLHGLMTRINEMYREPDEPTQSQSQGGQSQTQSQGTAPEPAMPPMADCAEAFVAAARALGIPARFVSGYVAAEDSDLISGVHNWAEAYDDNLGWIGFDPWLDVCPTDRHVRVAIGLDAESAAAVRSYPPLAGEDGATAKDLEIVVASVAAQ